MDASVSGFPTQASNVTLQVWLNDQPLDNMNQTITYPPGQFASFDLTDYVTLEANDRLRMTLTSSAEENRFYFSVFGSSGFLSVRQIR